MMSEENEKKQVAKLKRESFNDDDLNILRLQARILLKKEGDSYQIIRVFKPGIGSEKDYFANSLKEKWFEKYVDDLLLTTAKKTSKTLMNQFNFIWNSKSIFITDDLDDDTLYEFHPDGVTMKKINSFEIVMNIHLTLCEKDGVLGFAVCSPVDKYSKKEGDYLAKERYAIAKTIVETGDKGKEYKTKKIIDPNTGKFVGWKKMSGFIVKHNPINVIKL